MSVPVASIMQAMANPSAARRPANQGKLGALVRLQAEERGADESEGVT